MTISQAAFDAGVDFLAERFGNDDFGSLEISNSIHARGWFWQVNSSNVVGGEEQGPLIEVYRWKTVGGVEQMADVLAQCPLPHFDFGETLDLFAALVMAYARALRRVGA